jgi:hypothetical protein
MDTLLNQGFKNHLHPKKPLPTGFIKKSKKPSRFLVQNLGKENQKLIGFWSGFIQNSIFK